MGIPTNPPVPMISWSADDLDALAKNLRQLNEMPDLRESIASVKLRVGPGAQAQATATFERGEWRILVFPPPKIGVMR